MSDVSSEELALLDAAKDAWGPEPDAAAAKAAIEARLAAGGADLDALLEGAPLPAAAPPRASTSLLRSPAVVGGGLVAVGLVVASLAMRKDAPPAPVATPAPPVTVAAPAPCTSTTSAPSIAIAALPDAPAAPSHPVAPRASAAAPPADESSLDAELALLRAAHAARGRGALSEAHAALASHASTFPRGVLREERLALEALVLCDEGDVPAAQEKRAELERVAPRSSHLARLSTSCARR